MAHRIALDLNNAQTKHLLLAAETARFAYNWALGEWKRQYEAWKADHTLPKPSQQVLRRQLNAIQRERSGMRFKRPIADPRQNRYRVVSAVDRCKVHDSVPVEI